MIAELFYWLLGLAFAGEVQRLDPHGHIKSNFEQACSVCHEGAGGAQLKLKGDLQQSCRLCHNSAPHSGVQDHVGKKQNGKEITCLSCHSPHRWDDKPEASCTICHKWSK